MIYMPTINFARDAFNLAPYQALVGQYVRITYIKPDGTGTDCDGYLYSVEDGGITLEANGRFGPFSWDSLIEITYL